MIGIKIKNIEMNFTEKWLADTNIRTTPMILFNGYELPEKYKIEDIKYFTELDI
jgi:hypothetical protein